MGDVERERPGKQPDGRPAGGPVGGPGDLPAGGSVNRAFAGWMGSMWLFTLLRFALFFALWGILVLVGLKVLFAALVGLVLSVPLSFVLLAKPRAAFTANLEARLETRRADRADLDAELDPDAAEHEGD